MQPLHLEVINESYMHNVPKGEYDEFSPRPRYLGHWQYTPYLYTEVLVARNCV